MERRETKQRRIIIEELRKVKTHPNANEVYRMARKKMPDISFATVYRNLKMLRGSGKIMELDGGRFRRFDGNPDNHYHFSCLKCGRMCDIDEPIAAGLDKKIAKSTGFRVFYHNATFFGKCRSCVK